MIELSIFKKLYINGVEINSLLLNSQQIWKKVVEEEYYYEVENNLYGTKINGYNNQEVTLGEEWKNATIEYTIIEYKKSTHKVNRAIDITRTLDIIFTEDNVYTDDNNQQYYLYHDDEYNIDVEVRVCIVYDKHYELNTTYGPPNTNDYLKLGEYNTFTVIFYVDYYIDGYLVYDRQEVRKNIRLFIPQDLTDIYSAPYEYEYSYFDEEYGITIPFRFDKLAPDEERYQLKLTTNSGNIYYADRVNRYNVIKIETTNICTTLPVYNMWYDTNTKQSVEEVVIGTSVTKFTSGGVFEGCVNLNKITFLSPTPPQMGYDFAGVVKNGGTVYVPYGSYDAYYAILNDWHGTSLTTQGWTIEEMPAGEIISTVYEFYDIESPTVNATDTSCDITYSYKETVYYDSGITKEKIYEFVQHVTFDENTSEDEIEITGSFVSEFGDTINYTITQTGASSSGGGDVVLDWGTDSNVSYITPDPATRSYATALTDNMAIGSYAKLRFTRPDKAAESGYYGDGIDGLIKCVTYNTTSATYAGDTNVIGNKSLLTTWKNNGAKVTMAYVDKAFSRYGNDFIFAGPSGVNVLGFCVLSGHVADNIRYDRYIIVNAPNTTTADGRHALRISNGEFYSGSSYGYIVAVIYS